jgi:hypothetical protein
MTEQLNESLQYLDMERQMLPIVNIDQYESKIGDNSDYVTISFTMNSKAAADDLCSWLERGYDWVIDADTSPGEVNKGKFLVFVEMNRRLRVPERIIEMLDDLETLTGLTLKDWKLNIGDKFLPANEGSIRDNITLSPHDYRMKNPTEEESEEADLNEMRELAGLEPHTSYVADEDLKFIQRRAGII